MKCPHLMTLAVHRYSYSMSQGYGQPMGNGIDTEAHLYKKNKLKKKKPERRRTKRRITERVNPSVHSNNIHLLSYSFCSEQALLLHHLRNLIEINQDGIFLSAIQSGQLRNYRFQWFLDDWGFA